MVIDNSRQEEIESDSRATFPYAVVFEFETTMYVTNVMIRWKAELSVSMEYAMYCGMPNVVFNQHTLFDEALEWYISKDILTAISMCMFPIAGGCEPIRVIVLLFGALCLIQCVTKISIR